jgi:hypothetical protein
VWIITSNHGVGFSVDSVSYWGAAERLAEVGRLEIPVTAWSDPRDYTPLSHHAPLLSFVLGGAKRITGVAVTDLARVLNVSMLIGTAVCMGLATRGGVVSFAVLTSVLVTPTVFDLYQAFWSEPLFVALCSFAFLLLTRYFEKPSRRRVLMLGLTCSLAALTRYVGIFLPLAVCSAFLLARPRLRDWLADVALITAPFMLLVGGWFQYVSLVGAPARVLGWYPGALSQLANQFPNTVSRWVFPQRAWFPSSLGALLVIGGGGALVLWVSKTHGSVMRARAAGIFFLLYLSAVVGARVLADPSIPFDGRMLSPMVVFLGIAVAAATSEVRIRSVPGMAACLAAAVIFTAQVYRAPRYLARGQEGIGYESHRYASAGWLASLVDSIPRTTVFTNDPFLLATLTGTPIKNVPLRGDSLALTAFVALAKARSPSVIVLVSDAPDIYVESQELTHQIFGTREGTCPDVYLFKFVDGADVADRGCGEDWKNLGQETRR